MPTVRARVYATGASIGAAAAGCPGAEPTSLACTLSRTGLNRRDQGRSDVLRAANARPEAEMPIHMGRVCSRSTDLPCPLPATTIDLRTKISRH
jgi:hypothetical protein